MALILTATWMLIRHAGGDLDGENKGIGSSAFVTTSLRTAASLEKDVESLDVEVRSAFSDLHSRLGQPEKLEHRDTHRMSTDVPLATRYEGLVNRASSGDPIAAIDLAISLSYCAAVPRTDEKQDRLINYTYQTRRVHGKMSPVDDLEGAVGKIVRKYEFCKGITRDQILNTYLYEKIAAENGSLQAKAGALDGYDGGMHYDDVWPARDRAWSSKDEELRHRVRHTADAAEAGNAEAIFRLGDIFRSHDSILDDFDTNMGEVEAAAYRIVGAHLLILSGETYAQSEMQRTINSLSLHDANTAITLANEIIRRDGCCFVYRWPRQTEY